LTELKPCPFCGGTAISRVEKWQEHLPFGKIENHRSYGVICTDCECIAYEIEPGFENVFEAIEAWNRRVTEGVE
jgi:Lar family restriction alleviation protein